MVMVNAFRGLRYNPDKVDDFSAVVAPPYDVINPEEQDKLYEKSPLNVVRLELTKGDDDEKYIRASETFRKWIKDRVLIQDSEPCIYPYYQEFEDNGRKFTRKGFIAAIRLEDSSSKKILPHERTFPKHKLDRLKLTTACSANLSPVFAIYSDPEGTLQKSIEQKLPEKPMVDAIGTDGVNSRLWRISDNALISEIKSRMLSRNLLIADGHHRYETALEYRDIQRKKLGTNSGNTHYEYLLMYLCRGEDDGLVIKPTHRVVKDLGNLETKEFVKKLEERFEVKKTPFDTVSNLGSREFAVFTGDSSSVFKISTKEPVPIQYNNLAVMLLHKLVFGEILREEEAQILYTKSTEEVVSLVT
ncbi:MAG: DUF1015 domain-containing protein, partial [Thermodesulfobacteriota bacterium]